MEKIIDYQAIRDEIHDGTNILYNYVISITIPILECILKREGLTMYKGSLYYIYFKLNGTSSPHITTKEYLTDIPRQREEYEVIYGTRRNVI